MDISKIKTLSDYPYPEPTFTFENGEYCLEAGKTYQCKKPFNQYYPEDAKRINGKGATVIAYVGQAPQWNGKFEWINN